MMKVAIVGATGVLGRALIPLLLAKHEVRALARRPDSIYKQFGNQVEALECDLLAPGIAERLPALLAGCEVVIHAATAIPPVADMGKPGAWDANTRLRLEGTAHLLAATLQVGAQGYIQQSITMAYPDCGDRWISEDVPFRSTDDNGKPVNATVIAMERQVRAVPIDQLRWSILRGSSFVGKGTFQEDTIAGLRAGTEKVACEGKSYRSMIHFEDMASAGAAAVDRAPAGSTFNICDKPLRQRDYLDRLADAVGASRPQLDADAPCPISRRCANQAAQNALNWSPTHGVIPNSRGIA
jgi:nucleoside-diphosphate-sugar epimerase